MDFFRASQLSKGREAALLIDYTEFRNGVINKVKGTKLEEGSIFAICKQEWKSQGMIYLFLCLVEKESVKEFSELFYEISLSFYVKCNNDPLQRCIDICSLYLFYSMQNPDKVPIGLNHIVMNHLITNQWEDLDCTKDLLKLLMDRKAFIISYLAGLKTRVISKRGEVMKFMAFDSDGNQLLNKTNQLLVASDDLLNLKKLKMKYLETKKHLLKDFVANDPNELLDYDEDTGLVSRKLQEELNKITRLSLDIEKLQITKE